MLRKTKRSDVMVGKNEQMPQERRKRKDEMFPYKRWQMEKK